MKNASKYILGIAAMAIIALSSCKKKEPIVTPPTNEYDVPQQYSFENVNYTGQTVRLLLLKDLIAAVKQPGVTKAQLVALYDNTDAKYADIATNKKLSDKIYNADMDAQIRAWFDSVEVLSAAGQPLVLQNGFDLPEAIEKTLMGGVFFHRAMEDYLHKLTGDDNSTVTEGNGTEMEHHFDEAFGYFGAARNYNDWTDAEIRNPGQKDVNGDGKIDPNAERNFFFGQYAASRDAGTANLGGDKTDFTKTLFDAFLKGRAAISNKDYTARDEAVKTINETWQKVIAAAAIHYVNSTKADLNTGADASKHWSELYGFTQMFGYNSQSAVSQADRDKIKELVGTDLSNITVAKLDEVNSILKNTFGFTDAQVNAW